MKKYRVFLLKSLEYYSYDTGVEISSCNDRGCRNMKREKITVGHITEGR